MFSRFYLSLFAALTVLVPVAHAAEPTPALNLYSAQQEHLIRPLLDAFTKDTNIRVNLVTLDPDPMTARLTAEGKDTPADVVLTVNVGNFHKLQQAGLLKAVQSDVLNANVPAALRSKEGYWYAIGKRARVLYKRKGDDISIKTYEELADPKWKKSVLVRSSANEYNISLLASLIKHDGREKALEWAKAVVANFARTPEGSDRDQLRALGAGQGRIAIANTYYYGLLVNSEDPKDREYADKIEMIFPNQDGRGAHINIRGAAVVAHAKHPELAVKLLEYLTGEKAQALLAEKNFEYPANPAVPVAKEVASWGPAKFDAELLDTIGALNAEAVKVFDEAKWP